MAEIVLTGLAADDPVPGSYVQINFAVGELGIGNGQYFACVIGNLLASGAGSVNTIYGPTTAVPMNTEADAISLFGAGSELHRMVRRFLNINPTTPLFAIAVAENGAATVATGDITVVGTATQAGTLRIYVGDEFVDVGFITNDTPTVIATAAIAQINAKSYWPVTASNVAGVITLTTKQKGLRANFVRFFARVIPFTGTGVTVTPVASTFTSGGAASDDITTVLPTLNPKRFYYLIPAAEDSTQLAALATQINTQALPLNNIRQRMVAASIDSLANTITVVNAINAARDEMVWLQNSDVPPCEMAAHNGAVYSLEEAPFPPKLNFDSYGTGDGESWRIKAPLDGTAPTRSQIKTALNSGITPIGVLETGQTYLVKRITTRYLNGAIVDYRIRDSHKVTVADRYADDLQIKQSLTLKGALLANDPVNNEPTVSGNSTNPVVTPRVVKALVDRLTDDYAEDAMLQNATTIKAQTIVQRSGVNTNRVDVSVPLQPIDVLDQIANEINQVA